MTTPGPRDDDARRAKDMARALAFMSLDKDLRGGLLDRRSSSTVTSRFLRRLLFFLPLGLLGSAAVVYQAKRPPVAVNEVVVVVSRVVDDGLRAVRDGDTVPRGARLSFGWVGGMTTLEAVVVAVDPAGVARVVYEGAVEDSVGVVDKKFVVNVAGDWRVVLVSGVDVDPVSVVARAGKSGPLETQRGEHANALSFHAR